MSDSAVCCETAKSGAFLSTRNPLFNLKGRNREAVCLLEQLHFGSRNQSSTVHLDRKTHFDSSFSGSLSNEAISMLKRDSLSCARIHVHFLQKGVNPLIHSERVTNNSHRLIINQHERIPYTNHPSSILHSQRHYIPSNNTHIVFDKKQSNYRYP